MTDDERMEKAKRTHLRYLEPWLSEGGLRAEMLSACFSGDAVKASELLAQDLGLAAIPSGEVTPLRLAAYYGHAQLAKVLLDHGAPHDVPASDRNDFPLHLAARQGHTEVVEALIRRGADVDAGKSRGETPLVAAATGKNAEVVRLLAEAGADLEVRSPDYGLVSGGGTALQIALFRGWDHVIEELVRHGADVNAETSERPHLGFSIDTEHGWPLIEMCEVARPLYLAVCCRTPAIAELLLDHGAEINALSFGWSALHAAVAKPDPPMVELLIRRGADPYVQSDVQSPLGPAYNHRTPMDLLAGFRRTVELLREAESPNRTDI